MTKKKSVAEWPLWKQLSKANAELAVARRKYDRVLARAQARFARDYRAWAARQEQNK